MKVKLMTVPYIQVAKAQYTILRQIRDVIYRFAKKISLENRERRLQALQHQEEENQKGQKNEKENQENSTGFLEAVPID